MTPRTAVRLAGLGLVGAGLLALPALADERRDWFDKAVAVDFGTGNDAARDAYGLYRRAAEAGLPEAEFNVAAMLDSGRGVAPNTAAAATWYARAGSHGNQRAAYNLGQLYEGGQGVPRNADLARAWFAASGLPAGRERLAQLRAEPGAPPHAPLNTPTPVAPTNGERVDAADGGLELVWTSPAQAEPVSFRVELRRLSPTSSEEVFSRSTETSSLLASVPNEPGDYAWRVLAVAPKVRRYATSAWTVFHLGSE